MSENKEKKGEENVQADRMGTMAYSSKDNESMHKSLNGEFILYQILLKQILDGKFSLNLNEKSLYEHFQPSDPKDKSIYKEFDKKYKASKAINWYTRESCVYKTLNKALRTQDIKNTSPFATFIKDLNTQLTKEHQIFIKQQKTSTIQLYRGQFLSKDELNRLKTAHGELISMNSFLSTSKNRKKAFEFAKSRTPPSDDLISILLELNVNINSITKPYADIERYSDFQDEEEILFVFGSMFRMDNVQFDEQNNLWIVTLTLCANDDPDIKQFLSILEKETEGQNSLVSMGNNLMEMNKFDDAYAHLERILNNKLLTDPIDCVQCHLMVGKVEEKRGNYNASIDQFNNGLDYLLKDSSLKDHQLVSQCYNSLGYVYCKLKEYEKAFQYFELALNSKNNDLSLTYLGLAKIHFKMTNYHLSLEYLQKILHSKPEPSHAIITETNIYIGSIYAAMNNNEEATKYFDKVIELQIRKLSKDHPDLGYTYNAIGLMSLENNAEQKAYEYFSKAYQLQSQSLPNNHPDFAKTFTNFGNYYMKLKDLDNALIYYEKALENQLKTLSWRHPSVVESYLILGNTYWKKRNFDQAAIYFDKVLKSELAREKISESSLSLSYKILGDLYYDKSNVYLDKKILDEALDFYLNDLKIELKVKLHEDLSLVDLYKRIAEIFYKKHNYGQAILHYNRLLDCYYKNLPINQIKIDEIYEIIGKIYLKRHHFNETLLYYQNQSGENENKHKHIDDIYFEKRYLDQSLNYFQDKLLKYRKNSSQINNIYYILGNISYDKQNYDQSLKYFFKLFNKNLKKQNFNDLALKYIYEAIAMNYFHKQNYNQSLTYFYRLIECLLMNNTKNYSFIDKIYNLIGKIYLDKDYTIKYLSNKKQNQTVDHLPINNSQFEKYYLEQTLMHFQNLLKNNKKKNDSLDDIYRIIANIYLKKRDFNQSLNYFHQSINYQPEQSLSLAQTYILIGEIYRKQHLSNYALQSYQDSLNILQSIKPRDQSLIDNIQKKIRKINSYSI
ncbi:unnamed protein product [Adineta steineri]|uniref:Uncharacterized protein n=1 Tax=Adineta steineri TaxID=433720 RepID=A0A814KK48_9BILA|nr:unnamed protein product [Adineta steineri]